MSAIASDGSRVFVRSTDEQIIAALLSDDPLGAPLELSLRDGEITLVSV
jgi:hypothetical protein